VITAVSFDGKTATLSNTVTGTVSVVDIHSSNAVPSGAYNVTIVSDAAANATATVTIPTSTSTFTVAGF